MRKISSVIMACAMCLSMAVVGTVAPQVAVQAEETATAELKEAPTETPTLEKDFGYEWYLIQYSAYTANSENTKSWMEKITSIKVNDAEPYTKVDNKFLMKEDTFRANVSMVYIIIENKEFTKNTNKVVISANREGLISMVNHLLNLAQVDVPCGTHIHLDEYNALEDGSIDLIIEKI